ncbi:MAG TPA: PDZ domain-containing protein [Gemmataceae bacterium]|jgi:hypothetical protein
MKTRHLLLTVLGLMLAISSPAAEQPAAKPIEKAAAKPIVIPFELLKSGHMAVMVKVNGKGPYRVIFDTGAPVNLFNNKLAKEADLLRDVPKSSLPFLGTIAEVKVKELQVGDEKAAGQPAIVMDHPLVELMSKKLGALYGIVGFPFFARYTMTIDYQAETLTLVPNGYKPANAMKSLEATMFQMIAGGSPAEKVLSPAAQWGLTARKGDDDKAGIVVKEVLAGSAAAEAGLKPGDRLLTVDGRWTDSLPDLYEVAGHIKPGVRVPVKLQRDGKEMELQIKPRAGL